ncbi:hypothetical protein VPX56_00600 [Enterobacter wuhouensis]|uniref:Autotransporter outer membrane beta-barrel domain-containing protein n=1 Tax=Enterobacter wuhouensis TaxID=2529381 RepID=A0ABZ1DGM9_9ENTR|nr:hypothetical protein [Enterobacter wuhouensis]WRW31673.1 hypothetical protein VPX56_00600 [Enterobacter wuhouensis]
MCYSVGSVMRQGSSSLTRLAGLRVSYAGSNGWSAQASAEAGPNLGFSKSARKASLEGVKGQQFSIDDGKRSGGVNSQVQVGANYNAGNSTFGVNAFQWKEDGASDQGMSLNFSRRF